MGVSPSVDITRYPKDKRDAVFDGAPPSLEAFAKVLAAAKNVVVVAGAGISTSCGIPDFRSPDSGLYATLARRGFHLPAPESIFDISYFRSDPCPFFRLARDLFPGQYAPSTAHYFIRLLSEKGKLRRVYTQNIDTLERVAGIPASLCVEAHGSFATATCTACGAAYDLEWMKAQLFPGDGGGKGGDDDGAVVPLCTTCDGVVKPDITFFGETLPARYFACIKDDLPACDALIVMGTSLSVAPVSSIPFKVSAWVPRLLINREAVGLAHVAEEEEEEEDSEEGEGGGGEGKADGDSGDGDDDDDLQAYAGVSGGFAFRSRHNYRDVFLQADADDGVVQLCKAMGWEADLHTLRTSHHAVLRITPHPPPTTIPSPPSTSSSTAHTTGAPSHAAIGHDTKAIGVPGPRGGAARLPYDGRVVGGGSDAMDGLVTLDILADALATLGLPTMPEETNEAGGAGAGAGVA